MSIQRIFWSILAGVSISMAACGSSEYGPPPDGDASSDPPIEDTAVEEVVDDLEPEVGPMYGPVEYGPPPP